MTSPDCYAAKPLGTRNGIPYFSAEDDYVRNYEKISADHMASFEKDGTNPFMEEEFWVDLEESTAALVRAHARPGDRILDVGVGLARLLSRFPELERYGLDISWEYLEHSRQAGVEVCFSRIEDMPYKEDYFDIIVCTDVLEHVLDLNQALRRILAVLKPGGVLVVRVPYREDLALYLEPGYPYHFVHLRTFDEHSLELLFTRIFDCDFLQTSMAGYLPSRRSQRFWYPLPKWDKLTALLVRLVKPLSKGLHSRLLRLFYNPIDINVVVRRKAPSGGGKDMAAALQETPG